MALARQAGDLASQSECLQLIADLDVLAGRFSEAQAHLAEAIELALPTADPYALINCLETCGHLCARTHRHAEAVTVWAALAAVLRSIGVSDNQHDADRRQQPLRKARLALEPARARAAEERGAAMTAATAAEYTLLLVSPESQHLQSPAKADLPRLSTRERELVTLVAQGRTNAQIAGQLFISVRTVGSHLDRIRDKTGCRRRADLTRLALQAGLV